MSTNDPTTRRTHVIRYSTVGGNAFRRTLELQQLARPYTEWLASPDALPGRVIRLANGEYRVLSERVEPAYASAEMQTRWLVAKQAAAVLQAERDLDQLLVQLDVIRSAKGDAE